MSKAAMWAALAVIAAISLIVVGQWVIALFVLGVGGFGYIVARCIEGVQERDEQTRFRS